MKKYSYWLLPVLWMAVIFRSSATPYQEQDMKPFLSEFIDLSFLEPVLDGISFRYHHAAVSVEALGVAGFIEFFVRKGAHVTVYLILFCLFYLACRKSAQCYVTTSLFISILLSSVYAGLDEFHQGFTQNRTPYIGDVGLDIVGAIIGCLCVLFVRWLRKRAGRGSKLK
ncbi:VanZ family protein [Virgibacillus flavescens]|uniref:VanZ family protein n=1 Tax=Virgibacillus flavescens TaxID=1611422 RepID=UPI003D34F921